MTNFIQKFATATMVVDRVLFYSIIYILIFHPETVNKWFKILICVN